MICVAANDEDSFENVEKWQLEIQEVDSDQPIFLILTKKDLIEELDDPVTIKMLKEKSSSKGLQGAMGTSSKVWEDFNVHTAFNKTLATAYHAKYDDD